MSDLAATFRSLHDGPEPLRLVNACDRLSARVFALAGAPAIGTSSFAVALSRGYADGQHIPAAEVVATAKAMVEAVEVPVTVDIEAGYGADPSGVDRLVGEILAIGAVGINLEDGRPDAPGQLFEVDEQCDRLAAARARAEREGVTLFINARSDVYFGANLPEADKLPTLLDRLKRYVDSGADGVFVPGLTNSDALSEVAQAVPVPLNVMAMPGLPAVSQMRDIGVRRISQGGAGFLQAIGYLDQFTQAYLQTDDLLSAGGGVVPGFRLLGDLAH